MRENRPAMVETAGMHYFVAPEDLTPDDPNPFSPDKAYGRDWVGLSFTSSEDCFYGTTQSGLFLQRFSLKWCDPLCVVADFVRYETSQGRKPVLFLTGEMDGATFVKEALASTPAAHVVRETDEPVLVHSTALAAGREILLDGEIKSWACLAREGKTPTWHRLRSSDLGEPADYADLIQLDRVGSAGCEVVVASHQSGRYAREDEPYEPGMRFYVDAHKVIRSGLDVRFSGGVVVRERLPLQPFVRTVVSLLDVDPEGKTSVWTPNSFTAAADEMFLQRVRR